MTVPTSTSESLLIVGAGIFGLGLAYELKTGRGYSDITVLDRHEPPVPDGSSVDVSRVIRSEYADPFYGRLAREAIEKWRAPPYDAHYHESGFVMLASDGDSPYFRKAREQSSKASAGATAEVLGPTEAVRRLQETYPGVKADIEGMTAATNSRGGWADAAGSVRALAERCRLAGITFLTGKQGTVKELVRDETGKQVKGVRTADGSFRGASRVVLATGAWTIGLVNGLEHALGSSGQPVGFVQLTSSEAASLMPMPVMINMDTGVFVFPPTPDTNELKLARHGFGYATSVAAAAGSGSGFPDDGSPTRTVSGPKTESDNAGAAWIPEDASEALREGLRKLVPPFGDRPWSRARLCWYTDTPEGDFVVDHHPSIEGLFVATGGSGHAFKMMPVLGRYVADCFERTASEEVRHKWRLRPSEGQGKVDMGGDGSRGGPPLRLLSEEEQARL